MGWDERSEKPYQEQFLTEASQPVPLALHRNEFPCGTPARATPTSFIGGWGIGSHDLHFFDAFLRKKGLYPAGIAGCYKWGGGLRSFVLQVVVTPAESSLSDSKEWLSRVA